jgi:hypothetical protein
MIFCKTPAVDAMWRAIVLALSEHKLGPSAKVSPRRLDRDGIAKSGSHVFCVYTKDYTNEEDVMRVACGLAQAVAGKWKGTLRYKPDLYTYLDIYSGNSLCIPASVWTFDVGMSRPGGC